MEGAGYRQSSQFRQFYPSPDSAAVTAAAALHGYHSKWDLLRFQQVYGASASGATFVPIHCIVEQTASPSSGKHGTEANVELDTYAILPSSALFSDIVRIALLKIGYSSSEAMGAKGTIQIRNWKPLTFDTITENPDATIEEVLGDMTSLSTLRLRLCSQSKRCVMDEIKEKLLQFLLQRSQGMLSSSGCPIEKTLLSQMSKGEFSMATIPAETRQAFNKWYLEQQRLGPHPPLRAINNKRKLSDVVDKKPNNFATSTPVIGGTMSRTDAANFSLGKLQTRASFDHEHEIPRLQQWFAENQHPKREQMIEYLNDLNLLDCRKGGKPLDLANISYWFKNARASLRRVNKSADMSENVESCDDGDMRMNDIAQSQLSPMSPASTVEVPELPNRNAVYVVNPLLSQSDGRDTEVVRIGEEQMADPDHMDPTPENYSSKCSDGADPANTIQSDQRPSGGLSPDLSRQNGLSPLPSCDDQATDLSLKHRKNSTESITTQDSQSSTEGARVGRLVIKEEGHSRSTSSAATPSPSGDIQAQYDHKPLMHMHSQQQLQQHAMQMAAMSQALNLHYVHPAAALYHRLDGGSGGGGAGVTNFPSDPKLNLGKSASNWNFPSDSKLSLSTASNNWSFASDSKINLSTTSSNCSFGSEPDRKKRSRVFIDPLTEIPKLEVWFLDDTHPSSHMIEKYTEELNRSPYRMRFPKLEAKNVQLWFKNHRAKVKRARLESLTSEALLPPEFPDTHIQEAQGAALGAGKAWDSDAVSEGGDGPKSEVTNTNKLCNVMSDADAQGRGKPWNEDAFSDGADEPDSKVAKIDKLRIAMSDADNSDGDRNTVSGSDTDRNDDRDCPLDTERDSERDCHLDLMTTPQTSTPSDVPHINQLSVAV